MAIEYFCCYHSYLDAMEQLNDAEKGRLFTACLLYSKTGESQQLGGNERFVFPFFKSQIDRDKAAYDERCERNVKNGKLGGRPKKPNGFLENPENPPVFLETQKTQGKGEGEGEGKGKGKGKEEGNNSTTPCGSGRAHAKDKPQKSKYGEYGWVRLTQEEYDRLLCDLGETELSRCIRYVDESAQSTGNKNKWSDWNLVLRKCSRDRWGISAYQRPEQGKKAVGHEDAPTNFERDAIRRMMGKTFDDDVPDF